MWHTRRNLWQRILPFVLLWISEEELTLMQRRFVDRYEIIDMKLARN